MITVGDRMPGVHLSETSLAVHPSGRIVALIRSDDVHCSVSDGGGRSWSKPRPTGMENAIPLHALSLESGKILCAHAHRSAPGGIRATLSHDGGESWDNENEIILRDDVPTSDYIGGPGSVQLDDGSIFTFYNIVKLPPADDQGRHHCYIAASIYTEDYVRPRGGQ